MSDTFLNNQEVTAEDLNNIAIDLGYADYSHFPEDPPQSAVSALNQITADLTSAGILQIGNKCAVSITDNTIVVQDGVCVFENGAKKRIEEPLTIPFIENSGTNYLYLFNNVAGNKIELVNSLTEPTTGDFVMLALITEKKAVHNRRTFSRSKIENTGVNATEEAVFTPVKIDYPEDSTYTITGQILNVDLTKYNYAITYRLPTNKDYTSSYFLGIFDLNNNYFEMRVVYDDRLYFPKTNAMPFPDANRLKVIDGVLCYLAHENYMHFDPKEIIKFV